jgi:ABC-type transport system involved in cytochrome c biogenesis permease subunit
MELFAKITIVWFAASYGGALALELVNLLLGRPALRIFSLIFGAVGLLAHTLYVGVQPLSLADPRGSLLFLAWILAVFYLYGSVHHQRLAWGLFVLPLVMGLVILGAVFPTPARSASDGSEGAWAGLLHLSGDKFWGVMHGCLLLLAAVGVCVGCIASIMYLVQVRRLRAKLAPMHGIRMYSLERIEAMNRRAVLWAFPFLTAGILVGLALQLQHEDFLRSFDLKTLSGMGLWIVFAVLLCLRYSVHVRGRQAAWWTLAAFVIMVFALVSNHSFLPGGQP